MKQQQNITIFQNQKLLVSKYEKGQLKFKFNHLLIKDADVPTSFISKKLNYNENKSSPRRCLLPHEDESYS